MKLVSSLSLSFSPICFYLIQWSHLKSIKFIKVWTLTIFTPIFTQMCEWNQSRREELIITKNLSQKESIQRKIHSLFVKITYINYQRMKDNILLLIRYIIHTIIFFITFYNGFTLLFIIILSWFFLSHKICVHIKKKSIVNILNGENLLV